ncbi:hypothetical protein [Variovorax saccharolyticus]|uniref:hypothetical protein n=1 Tax=Variovorax saccharolyticus TaxID=3053516 RepID=UPI002578E514|nr:hypothetical protein [Variovorax sp. J31P216]MDM0029916.1 hypothetical protein [Variovorax sp. J31P216]
MNCYAPRPPTPVQAGLAQAAQPPQPAGLAITVEGSAPALEDFKAFQETAPTGPDPSGGLQLLRHQIDACLATLTAGSDTKGKADDAQQLYDGWRAMALDLQPHAEATGLFAAVVHLLKSIAEHNPFVERDERFADAAGAGGDIGVGLAGLLAPTESVRREAARLKARLMPSQGPRGSLGDGRSKIDRAAVRPLALGPAFAGSAPTASASRLHYDVARDGDFKAFRSRHGDRFHSEVEEDLNAIAARIEPAAARARAQPHFADFLHKLKTDYFSHHTAQLWLEAKPALDLLVAAANNLEVPADTLQRAFAILIDGLTVCAPGICTHLHEACLLIAGGPAAWARSEWEALIGAEIQEQMPHVEPGLRPGDGVHVYNAYRNLIAYAMKIPERRDDFVALYRPRIEGDFTDGADLVKERVTPGGLVMTLGEQCHGRMAEAFATEERAQGKVSQAAVVRILNGFKDQYGDLDGHHVTVDKGNDDWAPGGRNSIAAAITDNLMASGVLRQQAAATLMHTGDQGEVRRLGYAIFVVEDGVYREVTDEEWARLVDTAPEPASLTQALSEQSTALDLGLCVAMKQRDVALREWRDLVTERLAAAPLKGELQVDGWLRGILQSPHLPAADKQALLSVALQEACRTGRPVVRDTCLEALAALAPADRRRILVSVPADAAALRRLLVARALRANEPIAQQLFRELQTSCTEHQLQQSVTAILQANSQPGGSLLYSALSKGHAGTIALVGAMMRHLPREALHEFLMARGAPSQSSGLFRALQSGHSAAITAYGELLRDACPDVDVKREILMCKRPDGIHGLTLALQNGHHEAIGVYGDLLLDAHMEISEILTAKTPGGFSGLALALQNGHYKAISVYGGLLRRATAFFYLSQEARHEILLANLPGGMNGLVLALQNGHHQAIAVLGGLLREAQARDPHLREILLAKTSDGVTGLSRALHEGHANAIVELGRFLEGLDDESKVDVLQCIHSDGPSALEICMKGGLDPSRKASTMRAYLGLIARTQWYDPFERKRLAKFLKKTMGWLSIGSLTFGESGPFRRLKKSDPALGLQYAACLKKLERDA